MGKKVIKGLIVVGLAFAIYMIGLAVLYDEEAWVRVFAYTIGVVMAYAAGMIVNSI